MTKKRLDLCVMELRGFSRAYAHEVIAAGLVSVDGRAVLKPGMMTSLESVKILAPDMPYVSRGGLKLAAALEYFGIRLEGLVCLDVGASTGGFTDCMLKAGARQVYAVDVGHGQLADALRKDPRVTSHENTDIRDFALPAPADFAACDLSFISLGKVLPAIGRLVAPGGGLICLIKPQFETGGRHLSKRGVVRDKAARALAVARIEGVIQDNGFELVGTVESPLTGRDGNVEYLAYGDRKGRSHE